MGPRWSHAPKGGKIVKPHLNRCGGAKPLLAKLMKVTPSIPFLRYSPLPTQPSDLTLAYIMDHALDIPLSSLIGAIVHIMREESTCPKGEERPLAVLTLNVIYLVNHGC
jgi:hypothetical protein